MLVLLRVTGETLNLGLVVFVNHARPFRASHNEYYSTDSENVIRRLQN